MPFKRQTAPTALIAMCLCAAATADPVTLQFNQALDLDTGALGQPSAIAPFPGADSGADVRIAYNADKAPHAVVVPMGTTAAAFVADTACTNIIAADVASLTFSAQTIDRSISETDCVVVRSDRGVLFKLGNPIESGTNVTLDYTRL